MVYPYSTYSSIKKKNTGAVINTHESQKHYVQETEITEIRDTQKHFRDDKATNLLPEVEVRLAAEEEGNILGYRICSLSTLVV